MKLTKAASMQGGFCCYRGNDGVIYNAMKVLRWLSLAVWWLDICAGCKMYGILVMMLLLCSFPR